MALALFMYSVYSFFFFFFKNLKRSETHELIYKTETDSQTQNEFMVGMGAGRMRVREFRTS